LIAWQLYINFFPSEYISRKNGLSGKKDDCITISTSFHNYRRRILDLLFTHVLKEPRNISDGYFLAYASDEIAGGFGHPSNKVIGQVLKGLLLMF